MDQELGIQKRNNTFGRKEALRRLLVGIDTLGDFVRSTSGSRGRTFILRTPDGNIHVTKDGVTLAKSVVREDPIEDLGCKLLQQAAQATVDEVGDGTTLTVILAQELIHRVLMAATPEVDLLYQLERCRDFVIDSIREQSKSIESREQLIRIASISTSSSEYGKLIGSLVYDVYPDGVINIEDGERGEVEVIHEDCHIFHRSYPHADLLGISKARVLYREPIVILTDDVVNNIEDIQPYVKESMEASRPLVIIAKKFSNVVIDMIRFQQREYGLKILPIYLPTDDEQEAYRDIKAILDGDNVESIEVYRTGFKIYSRELTNSIHKRIEERKMQLRGETTRYMREKIEAAIASLRKLTTTIYVDAPSKAEATELKDRIEDGVLASRSAMIGGYVWGGGLTLYNIADRIVKDFSSDEGSFIWAQILRAPLFQIVRNALTHTNLEKVGGKWGFNSTTMRVEDFSKGHIIDPSLVLISAIKNALSVAKAIINLGGAVNHYGNKVIPQFQEGRGFVPTPSM